jgi:hypothetical protein
MPVVIRHPGCDKRGYRDLDVRHFLALRLVSLGCYAANASGRLYAIFGLLEASLKKRFFQYVAINA